MTQAYREKTVLVTGASGGIGAEIAMELARRGAHSIIVARNEDRLAQVQRRITEEGGSATAMPADITDESDLKEVVARLKADFGQIHLLVNNAGREWIAPLQMAKPQAARELLELNVVATAEVTRSCLRFLKRGSAIVNMASVAGLSGAAGLSLYSASKAGVVALSRCWAREFAGRGIRVNAVAPGIVRTEMSERMFGKLPPEQVAELEAAHPLGFGSPRDVAAGVAFLGSDEAAWITGQTLVIDGGYSA